MFPKTSMHIIGQSDHLLIEAQITNIGYLENKRKIIFNTTKLNNPKFQNKIKNFFTKQVL